MLELLALTYVMAAAGGILVGAISLPLAFSRSTLFALTMTHSVLGGAILGIYLNSALGLGVPVPITATMASLILSVLAAELSEKIFSEDVAIALTVAISTTITIIFGYLTIQVSSTGLSEVWFYVAGTSAIATVGDLIKMATAAIIVAPLMHLISRELKYISFDKDGAAAMGLNVRVYRYLFFSLTAFATSTLASTLGVLATHVLLAVPGAVAMRFGKRGSLTASYTIAVALALIGYFTAQLLEIPPSGGIGLISGLVIMGLILGHERR
ncbi:MAG: iron chelate uptake ABC transporter family permease subunit [Nitrososphaerota archaeon]|nr:iron chelate uptake ABC transporter family permease subunit [Nitrososphaerota archaeon]